VSEFGQAYSSGASSALSLTALANISYQQSYFAPENGRVEKRPGIVSVCYLRSCSDARRACTVGQQSSKLVYGREDLSGTDPLPTQNRNHTTCQREVGEPESGY
jgi:hypothetical protein